MNTTTIEMQDAVAESEDLERILKSADSASLVKRTGSVYNDLVEAIRIKDQACSDYGLVSISRYSSLQDDVEALMQIEDEIERKINSTRSWHFRAYYAVRTFVFELVGKPRYTIEELFDIQLNHIDKINKSLKKINSASRAELLKLEQYSGEVMDNYCTLVSEKKVLKDTVKQSIDDLSTLRSALKKFNIDDPKYFECERAVRSLSRRMMELKHQYESGNEAIVDLDKESSFLDVIEMTTRLSLHMCESLYDKTERLSRHVRHTKRIYEQLARQQTTASALFDAVDTLGRYTVQIHRLLGNGIARMNATQQNMNITDFYMLSADEFSEVNNDVVENSTEKHLAIESQVETILDHKTA